ncbi:MAG: NUDIX hydrolase [Candidatus Verstraetearchaeota archaeon]|nr:NUDIX hydrolase [Candidatus Verstraetearchaeota archaeon]
MDVDPAHGSVQSALRVPYLEGTISSSRVFSGRVIKVDVDQVRLPSGRESIREKVVHPGAVAIVAIDRNMILMERQYRHTARKTLWEIPAGTMEEGETPEACARRELAEETGYTAELMERLAHFYIAPGYSTEVMYLFLAQRLAPSKRNPDVDEEIETAFLPIPQVLEMVRRGEIEDAKTIIGALYLEAFRPELRAWV